MKALVLALLLLALLSTQLPSPTFAQTNCTLNSCAVTVSRSITTNNWGVTFVSDQFSLTTGASPVPDHARHTVLFGQPTPIHTGRGLAIEPAEDLSAHCKEPPLAP